MVASFIDKQAAEAVEEKFFLHGVASDGVGQLEMERRLFQVDMDWIPVLSQATSTQNFGLSQEVLEHYFRGSPKSARSGPSA